MRCGRRRHRQPQRFWPAVIMLSEVGQALGLDDAALQVAVAFAVARGVLLAEGPPGALDQHALRLGQEACVALDVPVEAVPTTRGSDSDRRTRAPTSTMAAGRAASGRSPTHSAGQNWKASVMAPPIGGSSAGCLRGQ